MCPRTSLCPCIGGAHAVCFCARPHTCIGDAHTVHVREHPCASPCPKSPSKSRCLLGKRNQGILHQVIHVAVTRPAACCRICYLSCPGRISSKPVVFPALYHHLPTSAAIAAVQSWADSRSAVNLLHPSILCWRDAVPPATCLRHVIQQLDRQDKGGTRINPILLRVMFSFGIKSLPVIVCDMYPPFIALFCAVLFTETE